MPIAASSDFDVFFMKSMSSFLNGPKPLVISLPRKKLRHTGISETTARSW